MEDAEFKQVVYREIAAVVSALGDPRRLEIVDLLSQCDRNVESLADLLGLGITTVSHHLQVLKRARLVRDTKVGRFAYYRVTEVAVALWDSISQIASRELAEVKCAMADLFAGNHESIEYEELVRRVAAGEAVVLDVRPDEEYDAGHVPGALSVPLERLRARPPRLPRRKEIYAYCRGRYCVLSHEAVKTLTKLGYSASRLSVGVAEWKAAGMILQRSDREREA